LFGCERAECSFEGGYAMLTARSTWNGWRGAGCILSQTAGLPGWPRSADRARLQAKSLVSGNFTGNFAILRPRGTIHY